MALDSSTIFISYATDTKPLAEELNRALKERGIVSWVDFNDLQPGERWLELIQRAIETANWVLILVSLDSRPTAWHRPNGKPPFLKSGRIPEKSCFL